MIPRTSWRLAVHRMILAGSLILACQCAYQQNGVTEGAWVSHGQWHSAPKVVQRDLRDSGAQILYFEKNGSFTSWSGTLYSSNHALLTISAGDAETLYTGHWTADRSGPKVFMQKVYADIRGRDETFPGPNETISATLKGDKIFFRGLWFRREPALDEQMVKYAVGARQRALDP
jgi:hypothetical protein